MGEVGTARRTGAEHSVLGQARAATKGPGSSLLCVALVLGLSSRPGASSAPCAAGSIAPRQEATVSAELAEIVEELRQLAESGDVAGGREALDRVNGVLATAGPVDEAELDSLWQLASLAKELGSFDVLIAVRSRIHEIQTATLPEGHDDRIGSLAALGIARYESGDLEGAREDLQAVLDACDRWLPEEHPRRIEGLRNYATVLELLGDPDSSLRLTEQALELAERSLPEGDLELIIARFNHAVKLQGLGRLEEAQPRIEQALVDFTAAYPARHPNVLIVKMALGTLLAERGRYDDASVLLEEVVEAYEAIRGPDHPDLLRARLNLATLRGIMDDPVGARTLDEQVVAGLERLYPADHPELLLAQVNLASELLNLGDLEGARALGEKAVAGYELRFADDDLDLQRARLGLATTLAQLDESERAVALIEEVVAVYERKLPADHPDLELARINLAVARNSSGDIVGAIEILEGVLAARERHFPDSPRASVIRMNLAANLSDAGELDRARALIESVVSAYEAVLPGDHDSVLKARSILARTMASQGELEGARALLPAQLDGMTQRLLNGFGLAPREARALAADEAYRVDCALFLADPERFEPELATVVETRRHLAVHGVPADLYRDAGFVELGREVRAARARVEELALARPSNARPVDAWRQDLVNAARARDALLRRLHSELRDRGLVQGVEASDVCASLAEGDLAVGYLRYDRWRTIEGAGERVKAGNDSLLALVYAPDGTVRRVELGPTDAIEATIGAWRSAVGPSAGRGIGAETVAPDDGIEAVGRDLRRAIVDPVLDTWGADPDGTLYVCLDDLLHTVPLAALPTEEDGVVLGDVVEIRNELSFARLVQEAHAPVEAGGEGLLAVGGLDYDAVAGAARVPQLTGASSVPWSSLSRSTDATRGFGAWGLLPETLDEVEAICELFESGGGEAPVRLTGRSATKQVLFDAARGKRFVHVATHGWFAGESTLESGRDASGFEGIAGDSAGTVMGFAPLALSGLCLSGANLGPDSTGRVPGLLTAEELSAFDLTACELAVLSACETNAGVWASGQGILSLRAALHRAGARASITSLWSVDDARTRELMAALYENLWSRGQSKTDALRNAQRVLRERGEPASAWAAWVLTGDPD